MTGNVSVREFLPNMGADQPVGVDAESAIVPLKW